jgi:MGT family glycosyltransferase
MWPVKILLMSTPLTGHLNPLLAVSRPLLERGHTVACLSANAMRGRIEAAGLRFGFHAFPAEADLDLANRDELFPEWVKMKPGPERRRWILEHAYVDLIPAQHDGLQAALEAFPADVIIADNMMFGILPLLLGPRASRPPVVVCSATSPAWRRDDGAPVRAGLPPATSEADRRRYAALFEADQAAVMGPLGRRLAQCLAAMDLAPPATDLFDALVTLPDAYLQITVPSFEFPRRDLPQSVHFVGILPNAAPRDVALPAWAGELDGSRKVVLVTQGTLANYTYDPLITPTLTALADDADVLVLITTGGRPIDSVPGPIPGNARLTRFVPFDWLLPKVDLLVTNGGYGSVNQALSYGVPVVAAGVTEDKADVNARVAWSGVGVDLATNAPTPAALRDAIRKVLNEPAFRRKAQALAGEFRRIDTRSDIVRIVSELRTVMA